MAGNGIGIGIGLRQGTLLNLKPPTAFTSSFVVDTILGQLNWTNNEGATAQYEVYSSTNGGADVLLATTAAGATSYQDTTCKQNASVVYKIRLKKGTKFGNFVSASALATPLCWKTNQSTIGTVTINTLNIAAGKSVTVNWGDGTSQAYSGNNTNITKNYASTGQYNIWLSGDTNSITSFVHNNQSKTFGVISNWILPSLITLFRVDFTQLSGNIGGWVLPSSLVEFLVDFTSVSGDISGWVLPSSLSNFQLFSTSLSGDISNWVVPSSTTIFNIYNASLSGKLPQISAHATNAMNYQAQSLNLSDTNVTVFRKGMTVFNVSSQKVAFPTANIDKLLKALADWYQVNAPTANCTFTMNGANMGIPTGGASNADITRLVGYYTAAGRTATVIVRTS